MPWAWIHDMRRGAVRRLERASVARSVATKITGHKSESVYKRYAVTSERDVAEGLAKVSHLDPLRAQIRAQASEVEESRAGGGEA